MRFAFPYVLEDGLAVPVVVRPGNPFGTEDLGKTFGLDIAYDAYLATRGLPGKLPRKFSAESQAFRVDERTGPSAQFAALATLAWEVNKPDFPGLADTELLWLSGRVELDGKRVLLGPVDESTVGAKVAAFMSQEEARYFLLHADQGDKQAKSLGVTILSFDVFAAMAKDPQKHRAALKALVGVRRGELEKVVELFSEQRTHRSPVVDEYRRINIPARVGYKARPRELRELRAALLRPRPDDAAARVAVVGEAGAGKSVLAATLAKEPDLQNAFPDGIVRVDLGWNPNVQNCQENLVSVFEGGQIPFLDGLQSAHEYLRRMLADKRCLLILDNVWRADHIEWLDVLSKGGTIVTTRFLPVADAFRAIPVKLGGLENAAAVELLLRSESVIAKATHDLLQVAQDIVALCSGLPQALEMVGSSLDRYSSRADEDRHRDWLRVHASLREAPIVEDDGREDRVIVRCLHVSRSRLALDLASRLLSEGEQREQVLIRCMRMLGTDEERAFATKLLNGGERREILVLHCLKVLERKEGLALARTLIANGERREAILLRGLELMFDQEAQELALTLIANGERREALLLRCLKAVGRDEERELAHKLIEEGVRHEGVLLRYLDVLKARERPVFAAKLANGGERREEILVRCLAEMDSRESFALAVELVNGGEHREEVLYQCLKGMAASCESARWHLQREGETERVLIHCRGVVDNAYASALKLLENGERRTMILLSCLKVLDAKERVPVIGKLMNEGEQQETLLIRCLNLIDDDERAALARVFMDRGEQAKQLFLACVSSVSEAHAKELARDFAIRAMQLSAASHSDTELASRISDIETELVRTYGISVTARGMKAFFNRKARALLDEYDNAQSWRKIYWEKEVSARAEEVYSEGRGWRVRYEKKLDARKRLKGTQ